MNRSGPRGVKASRRQALTLEELFARMPRIPVAPPDPKAGLWRLLDRLAVLRASRTNVAQHELADKILDLFSSFPAEAPGWYRAWQAAHMEAIP